MRHPHDVQISPVEYMAVPGTSTKIAYRHHVCPGAEVGILYLEGLNSDMTGCKSAGMEVDAQVRGKSSVVRFDFQGQGLSSGTQSPYMWVRNALQILDDICGEEPQVVVGSSMGAWIALHLALQRPQRVKALVLLSPAVDITDLWWANLSEDAKQQALAARQVPLPGEDPATLDSAYGECTGSEKAQVVLPSLPLVFFEECSQHLMLMRGGPDTLAVDCPVRIFHGMRDRIVPASVSRKLMDCLQTSDCHVTLIKDGNHRLSRAQDLSPIMATVQEMEDY